MTRIFVSQSLENVLEITDQQIVHHLTRVLRMRTGEKVCVVNEVCKIYEIMQLSNDCVLLSYVSDENIQRELNVNLDLAMAVLKKDNFELVLQKACELGVNKVIGLHTKNCVAIVDKKKEVKKLLRYNDILKNAAMQSQRLKIPQIDEFKSLMEIDYQLYDKVVCCYENEEDLKITDLELDSCLRILVIIGPEGGFDCDEIDFLKKQKVEIVSLGKRILRAETAAITAVSYVMLLND